MRILIADDDLTSRTLLAALLPRLELQPVVTEDGAAAWAEMQKPGAPTLAILDWNMPHLDGLEVCRRVRALNSPTPPYILMLTSRGEKEDIVQGLEAGANDYLSKPYDQAELRARLTVGKRMVTLQKALADQMLELQKALADVQTLQGFLPICCYCKKIRDDHQYWHQLESYISARAGTRFSHGVCPECYERQMREIHRLTAK